ncbi:MAG TPA: ankyrin repeat domain-containing protein [Vicinamibacterales bacterium]|nr:ankyrin repeat domain-containing protein [Vicinamibacterales bacterium]
MMADLASAILWVSSSPELWLLVKATLILSAALLIARLAARSRAAVRHLVIATAFASLMALPILIASVPAIAIQLPAAQPVSASRPAAITDVPPSSRAVRVATQPAAAAMLPPWTPAQWLRGAWIAGAIVFLIPVVSALWRLAMIRRTGLPVAWHRAELARLADARGVSLPVELLEHEAVPGPMTFGISRPVIVLPLDAREWSEAELRRALMHEIEHIQRGDWLMHIVARTVAAVYWFHPQVWAAWRRLCLEAERSCDDAVVMSEERTDYAEQLVTLAQRMSATPVQPMLGMANRSDLSTRVTAVLDERIRRGRAGLALAAGTMAAAALMVVTVAPVRAIGTAEAAVVAADGQTLQRKVRMLDQSRQPRKVRALDRALYEAALAGDLDEVKEILAAGGNPSGKIDGDGSPLIGAARSGRSEIAKLLLDHGADPNGVVEGDGSPLIAAAQRGQLDISQLLIAHGADVNLAVEGDENPLMNAAEGGHLPIVQLLVSKGADVHARIWTDRYDGGGEWRTALSQARKNRHFEVVKYLESLGARD